MTDLEFLAAFESCSLPAVEWTHQAHVRFAWLHLLRKPLPQAIQVVRDGIRRYNASLQKEKSYHETITQSYLHLIDDRMRAASRDQSFESFCIQNPDLLDRKMAILLTHYRKETLFSQSAREAFVKPDLIPLPRR